MRLSPYKVGSEPGNATKVVTLVKNVLNCRNSLYNLRHQSRTHFLSLCSRKILDDFVPADTYQQKRNTIYMKDIRYLQY